MTQAQDERNIHGFVVNKMLKDFVDMAKGEYNTLESLPVLKNTNAFFSTMTMLAMLGKAGISGMVDLPFSLLGTRGEKVNDQLQLWSKNLFAEIGDDVFAHSNSFVNWSLSLVKLNNLAIKNKDQRLKATIDSLEKEIFEQWVLTAKFHDYPQGWIELFKEAGYTGDYHWTIIEQTGENE